MSAKDKIHDSVKNALVKDGWTITHDPYTIKYDGDVLYADLAAERPLAALRSGIKIIVEVKSFSGRSTIQDFKVALGQYRLYYALVSETAPEYKLYLAVSDVVFNKNLQRGALQLVITKDQIPFIAIDIENEEVTQWIN